MAKKEKESAQVAMINKIKESLSSNISFVDEVAELLNLSTFNKGFRSRQFCGYLFRTACSLKTLGVMLKDVLT